jgi:hypothetical protein
MTSEATGSFATEAEVGGSKSGLPALLLHA